jgi:hypothetical protein
VSEKLARVKSRLPTEIAANVIAGTPPASKSSTASAAIPLPAFTIAKPKCLTDGTANTRFRASSNSSHANTFRCTEKQAF